MASSMSIRVAIRISGLCALLAFLSLGGPAVRAAERDTATPDLAELGRMVSRLPPAARPAAQTWMDVIQKGLGHGKVALRRAVELRAALGILTAGETPGTHQAWGGLVSAPADLLPIEDLNNVEVVEGGILVGGCQPSGPAWDLLKRKGIKTIVNLRKENNAEESEVRAHGMRPVYIPVIDQTAPTLQQARQFVALVDDPKNRPVYVHCRAGVGRTHTFIAAWRLSHGTSIENTLAEGKIWGLSVPAQINFLREFTPGAAH